MRSTGRLLGLCLLWGLCVSGCQQEQTTRIDLFYTADTEGFYYSRPEPRLDNRVAGGYAVLKNFLDKQTGPFLLFDGGNWFGTSPESALTQGEYMTSLLQGIAYSAGTVTAADFEFGWPALRGVVREQKFPFLVANLTLDNQIPWPLHDYQIFTQQGIKIGVFGLVNPNLMQRHKARLPGFAVQDPVEQARSMTTRLREKGVDFVVVLSSLGEEDPRYSDVALAGEVNGIDLILSSKKGFEQPQQEQINDTYIIRPNPRLDNILQLVLTFDKQKKLKELELAEIALLKETYAEDEGFALEIDTFRQNTRQKMTARLTQSDEEVQPYLAGESKLGNLLADCLHQWARLDGAILNAAALRSPLPAGVISEYDLYNTYPYGDNITFITIRGKDLIRALEACLEAKDNFPQIAGFSVRYSPQNVLGRRIKQVVLSNGRIVRPDEKYRFAITDHILAGGFGHDLFVNSLEFKNTFVDARQIMRACLIKQKKLKVPSLGRWKKEK